MIAILEEALGEPAEPQKRFPWALGDPDAAGHSVQPPFDAVWEARRLIVEVDEDRHRVSYPFWDNPDRLAVSGVPRGQQRHIYDERKRSAARVRGYVVVEIPWERRPTPAQRNRLADTRKLQQLLAAAGIASAQPSAAVPPRPEV